MQLSARPHSFAGACSIPQRKGSATPCAKSTRALLSPSEGCAAPRARALALNTRAQAGKRGHGPLFRGAGRAKDSAVHAQAPAADSSNVLSRPTWDVPPATWHSSSAVTDGTLTAAQVQDYFDNGFLKVEGLFPEELIAEVRADVAERVDIMANDLFEKGYLTDVHADADLETRLMKLTEEFADAPIALTKQGVLPEAFKKLYTHPALLGIAGQLGVGPGIAAHPAWNLRGKIPQHKETTVPWHQDNSYWEPRLWGEHIFTAWIPLVPTTAQNGTMQYVRGAHKSGRTARHTVPFDNTWYTMMSEEAISAELLGGEAVAGRLETVDCAVGDAILFGPTIPHRSLSNTSGAIRWSIDLRLHKAQAGGAEAGSEAELDWFYGLKDSMLLQHPEDPHYQPDWAAFAGTDRTQVQDEKLNIKAGEFDPIIVGPWMDLWDITHTNRHVDKYLEAQE